MEKNKPISLEDIIPSKPIFTVAGSNKAYRIRPPNMADRVWMKKTFGSEDELQRLIGEKDWQKICRVVYRLLDEKARADFPSTTATFINDEGDKMQGKLSGPDVLLRALSGLEDAVKMLSALTRAIIISNPLIEEAIAEEVKKSLLQLGLPIGAKFSTRSKANMGGQNPKSRR